MLLPQSGRIDRPPHAGQHLKQLVSHLLMARLAEPSLVRLDRDAVWAD